MKFKILHESKGRMRVSLAYSSLTIAEADILEESLAAYDFVKEVKVYERTGDAAISYTSREDAIRALAGFSFKKADIEAPTHSRRAISREFRDKLIMKVLCRAASKLFLPPPVRAFFAVIRASGYVGRGLKALAGGNLTVSVLDAAAITVSLIRRDFNTASSVMFMLGLGDILEEWTHKKSVADLAGAMSLGIDRVWLRADGTEMLVSVRDVKRGDCIVVRTGGMIPLDGVVTEGAAEVNQSSMTGESLPVKKEPGSYVYAGTVVEDGECVIRIEKISGDGRYDRVVKMIEESEKLKSESEMKALRLADRLVPYTFIGTAVTYAVTRNVTKMLSVLMVDFSCALKLSMPIAVLSAMRECSEYGISAKGGRFLEAVARADTIVFDKTGTLTYAAPRVEEIVTFGGNDENEMLRLAACLEEHYPHSLANAVVSAASERGLNHDEYHSRVEYVVAHGISSTVDGEKVVIGSAHFVFEDEGCTVPKGEEARLEALDGDRSYLYLAVGGELSAVICISDPLRPEAREAVRALKELGLKKTVMMTGDNEKTASRIAKVVGTDEYHAEVLPEDKAGYIRKRRAEGHTVIMVGDGVNDSPALSEADAGVAVNTGAAIAREIADITVSSENLFAIAALRRLSTALMGRISRNYRFIVGFNLALILSGVAGFIRPTTAALLHNASTLAISTNSLLKPLISRAETSESFTSESYPT